MEEDRLHHDPLQAFVREAQQADGKPPAVTAGSQGGADYQRGAENVAKLGDGDRRSVLCQWRVFPECHCSTATNKFACISTLLDKQTFSQRPC